MFNNLKDKIKELSYAAVNFAEETLCASTGKEKKAAAIEYIVSMLPVPLVLQKIVSTVLSKFIDEAIENAVKYMNNVKNPEA